MSEHGALIERYLHQSGQKRNGLESLESIPPEREDEGSTADDWGEEVLEEGSEEEDTHGFRGVFDSYFSDDEQMATEEPCVEKRPLWTCTACDEPNSEMRTACNNCGKPRVTQEKPVQHLKSETTAGHPKPAVAAGIQLRSPVPKAARFRPASADLHPPSPAIGSRIGAASSAAAASASSNAVRAPSAQTTGPTSPSNLRGPMPKPGARAPLSRPPPPRMERPPLVKPRPNLFTAAPPKPAAVHPPGASAANAAAVAAAALAGAKAAAEARAHAASASTAAPVASTAAKAPDPRPGPAKVGASPELWKEIQEFCSAHSLNPVTKEYLCKLEPHVIRKVMKTPGINQLNVDRTIQAVLRSLRGDSFRAQLDRVAAQHSAKQAVSSTASSPPATSAGTNALPGGKGAEWRPQIGAKARAKMSRLLDPPGSAAPRTPPGQPPKVGAATSTTAATAEPKAPAGPKMVPALKQAPTGPKVVPALKQTRAAVPKRKIAEVDGNTQVPPRAKRPAPVPPPKPPPMRLLQQVHGSSDAALSRQSERDVYVTEAKHRLEQYKLNESDNAQLRKFMVENGLGDEVQLGLRLMMPVKMRKFFDQKEALKWKLADVDGGSAARTEFVLDRLAEIDHTAVELVRKLQEIQEQEVKDAKMPEAGASGKANLQKQRSSAGSASASSSAGGSDRTTRSNPGDSVGSHAQQHESNGYSRRQRGATMVPHRRGTTPARLSTANSAPIGARDSVREKRRAKERAESKSRPKRRGRGRWKREAAHKQQDSEKWKHDMWERESKSRSPDTQETSALRHGKVRGNDDNRPVRKPPVSNPPVHSSAKKPPAPRPLRRVQANPPIGARPSHPVAATQRSSRSQAVPARSSVAPAVKPAAPKRQPPWTRSSEPASPGAIGRPQAPKKSPQSSKKLEQWLRSLDGTDTMLEYLPKLRQEFSSLSEVAAALTQKPQGNMSVLRCVEPSFFEALGVKTMGHRLLLAKGIAALAQAGPSWTI